MPVFWRDFESGFKAGWARAMTSTQQEIAAEARLDELRRILEHTNNGELEIDSDYIATRMTDIQVEIMEKNLGEQQ